MPLYTFFVLIKSTFTSHSKTQCWIREEATASRHGNQQLLDVGTMPQVEMYPSKSDGMFVPESLIFRSDSNGEDLEGYAGAGLYDSITMDRTELKKVDYASDR